MHQARARVRVHRDAACQGEGTIGRSGTNGTGPILVDDDELLRALAVEALRGTGRTVREAESGEAALIAARAERPALVLLDVRLPGISGYEVCRELRDEYGDALPIVFVSGERTESFDRVAGLLLGADDYVVKPFAPDELLARARMLLRHVPEPPPVDGLTRRERQVLHLLAEGRKQAEIARELVISPKTVGTHIEHILGKLGVNSRAQAVALAYRHDLVDSVQG